MLGLIYHFEGVDKCLCLRSYYFKKIGGVRTFFRGENSQKKAVAINKTDHKWPQIFIILYFIAAVNIITICINYKEITDLHEG